MSTSPTNPLVGTITELEPMDGLGWIECDGGSRVRFGSTACKGFVPQIGLQVAVEETTIGFRGVEKAVRLSTLQAPQAASAEDRPSAPAPRNAISILDSDGVPIDPHLNQVLARWDTDDRFNIDLETLMFEIAPMPATELDCNNPWFYVIAMDGSGNAYGLYLYPDSQPGQLAPWVFWDHEVDTIFFLATETTSFFAGLLNEAPEWGASPDVVTRVRGVLGELGVDVGTPEQMAATLPDEELKGWLPPRENNTLSVDEYVTLLDADPSQAVPGLMAHASRNRDTRATAQLKSYFASRGWVVPAWSGW